MGMVNKIELLHVDDATDALIKIMINNKFDTYNLGGRENIQIKSLAKKIIKLSNSQSKIKLIDYKRAYNLSKKYKNNYQDIINRHPSIKKIKKDLKFSPKKSLKTIIKDILNHFKN